MAVTKIKPIRGTVNKALTYILDPQKTDDAFYVSSYGCAASDAAAKEFEWTRNLAVQQGMQMPKVLARHLIQSFDIGEVTPEEAHEVGKQLADEWLKGKYEYVIATHIDKGHCHKPSFKAKHEAELVIFEAARSTLLAMQGEEKLPSLKTLQAEQQQLLEEQQRLYDERARLKKEVRMIDTMKANVDDFLKPSTEQEHDYQRSSQRE